MLRRAASVGSSGSLPNRSCRMSRMKKAYLPGRQIGRRPTPIQVLTLRGMSEMLARFVGIDQLAVDRAQNGAVGEVKQCDHDRRKGAELEAEEARAGERRDGEHYDQRSTACENDTAQPRLPKQIVMREAEGAAPQQGADEEMKQQPRDRRTHTNRGSQQCNRLMQRREHQGRDETGNDAVADPIRNRNVS